MSENDIIQAKTMDVTDKKCPNCAATIEWDPDTLAMTCPFCGYTKKLPKPEEEKQVEELDFNSAKLRASLDWGTKKKSIECKQCGGQTIYDESETASCCPFCGSTSVMPVDDDENVMAPGGVVPFEISNEKAVKLFEQWLKGKLFAPNAAKKSCKAENFNGVYLPYWTYDTQTTSSYSAKVGYDKKQGDKTVTTWKNVSGVYDEFIDDQVIYASKKINNPYIQSVSQFDFKKLRNYDPQFIAGYAAERYTVGLDDGWAKAKQIIQSRLKNNLSSKLRSQHKADRVSELKMATDYDKITFKYLLAPIWQANYKFNGKVYNFVINGQTGKVAGKAPVSPWKVLLAIAIAIIILVLIFKFS